MKPAHGGRKAAADRGLALGGLPAPQIALQRGCAAGFLLILGRFAGRSVFGGV